MKYFLSWSHLLLNVLVVWVIIGLGSYGDSMLDSFGSRAFLIPTQSLGAALQSSQTDQEPHFSDDGHYLTFTSDRL